MKKLILTLFLLHFTIFSMVFAEATNNAYSKVKIKTIALGQGIYMLMGMGGNIGVSVGKDGVFMIDDQFAPLTDKILAAIRELSDGDIRFVINTHVHGDHTGGNENLGKMGLVILARDEVRTRLSETLPDIALPVVTFSDTMTIHMNGEEVYIFKVPPAHTDGDTYIYFKDSDVIHAGDAFRTTSLPYIDRENGGTLKGTIDGLGLLIGASGPNTKIIPGHGEVSTREDVIAFRDMTIEISDRMAEMMERGMSYDQIAEADPSREYNDRYGDPERFLRAVYAELGGEE